MKYYDCKYIVIKCLWKLRRDCEKRLFKKNNERSLLQSVRHQDRFFLVSKQPMVYWIEGSFQFDMSR